MKHLFYLIECSIIFFIGTTFITAQNSVLADGEIYKIEINESGVYKLDYNYLKSNTDIDVDNINPKQIAIYGNGGRMLPEANAEDRINDLEENSIFVEGENDNSFDNGDFILFYAEGPKVQYYDKNSDTYQFSDNYYSNSNYYFIKIKTSDGLRTSIVNNLPNADYTITHTEKYQYHNQDTRNLLGSYFSTHGSGKTWYGEAFFSNNRTKEFGDKFDFTNIDLLQAIQFNAVLAVRSESNSTINLEVGDFNKSKQASRISKNSAYDIFASKVTFSESILLGSMTPDISMELPATVNQNEAWLDYIEITSQQFIKYEDVPMTIQQRAMASYSSASFNIDNYKSSLKLWNITDPLHPHIQNTSDGNVLFSTNSDNQKFLLFEDNNLKSPDDINKIDNQNLHILNDIDMLIVYHPEFEEEAETLATHRVSHNQMSVAKIDINQIYNEFSSGKCDPSAIRDFAKSLKDKNDNFKYMLLFGDGSYDYRGLDPELPAQNFIPVFETIESLYPITAFPCDDYFALLDDSEGGNLIGRLDIAVGRLPVNTKEQAKIVVNKIIHYETNSQTLGAWRLNIASCADDEDSHIEQIERIANSVKTAQPIFNQSKVYFDAYQQISTPGGHRFPAATEEINNKMFQGQLLTNYLGHGGPTGWAQERVLQIEDINSWKNEDKLTVMITATCSFAGYDDAAITTAGEAVLLNPNGGASALLTTTRAVFAGSNERLAQEVFNHAFMKINGEQLGIGEVLMMAKNTNKQDTVNVNARKFALLGDPAMRLAIPKYNINISSINGVSTTTPSLIDTLKALSAVKISGEIVDDNGQLLESFNGVIEPTIFDKPTTLRTLQNDSGSDLIDFDVQQNVLFKGAASVINGKYEYEFQMPKDIKFNYGNGKISHYASDGNATDAMGSYNNIIIGGTDTTSITDEDGPIINLYMDNEDFGYNGYTNDNPVLLINLSDISGINVAGTSVGHDVTGILDDDVNNTIIMNQYFKSTLNDYTSGSVNFPLSNLSLGHHTIKVKAWDIHNNPSEKILEFNVIDATDKKLYHVMNYPNPFVDRTNFRFEHGLPNTQLDILCQVYTVTGKLVKTISTSRIPTGQGVVDIEWNGKDEYEERLGKGVYLYKIKVISEELDISKESNFEKLVIL